MPVLTKNNNEPRQFPLILPLKRCFDPYNIKTLYLVRMVTSHYSSSFLVLIESLSQLFPFRTKLSSYFQTHRVGKCAIKFYVSVTQKSPKGTRNPGCDVWFDVTSRITKFQKGNCLQLAITNKRAICIKSFKIVSVRKIWEHGRHTFPLYNILLTSQTCM